MTQRFNSIEAVVADLQQGNMVIVVDDADRENEGDLIMAAQFVTPAAVNFMAKHGRGLICAPTTSERLQQLGIERMVRQNRETFKTDFQVSVDAARGITTGISAGDRAETIRIMADPTAVPDDLVQPGHVFPLRARPGGVLQRAGHTEAAVDLVQLAGCRPIGVICEIMSDDGSMARLPELVKFARSTGSRFAPSPTSSSYRRTREKLVERIEVVKLPTDYGDFDLHLYQSKLDGQHHLALVCGDVAGQAERAGARPQRMPDRRRLRLAPVRLRAAVAPGHAAGGRGRLRRGGLHAPGRPRHRPGAKSRPTNSRSRATTPSRPTRSSASTWTCANTASARRSSPTSASRPSAC